jgi:hypothetical protein
MIQIPQTRFEEKMLKHQNRVKANHERSRLRRANRILSKSLRVIDHSMKSCEQCSIDFVPILPLQRFHNFACLLIFNAENFVKTKPSKDFRGSDWEEQRRLAYEFDQGMCQLTGEQIGCDVHHIVPYRVSQDNSLYNLVTLSGKVHPIEDEYYRKWGRPSSWLIAFQKRREASLKALSTVQVAEVSQ